MTLAELRDAVRAGTATMNDFASVFPSETAYGKTTWGTAHCAFGGSLDAARALHEALLPGHFAGLVTDGEVWLERKGDRVSSGTVWVEGNPARSWLLAILDALTTVSPGQEPGQQT